MRLSKGFWQTFKEVPADAEIPSHQLMVRAGLIHKSGAGLYNYLPFGLKSIKKVEQIVREEMDRIGSYELQMTMVTPSELWKESGRWDVMTEMCKFTDKRESEVCMSPTNEETVVDVFRKNVKSYKQLPVTLYQINTKFRDEIRPRFGLMRAREFCMKDAYSFHTEKGSLDEVYAQMSKAYERVFQRLGLNFVAVEADAGAMASSDQQTHEFQVLAETGEDQIVYAPNGYAANVEKAKTRRAGVEYNETGGELEDVETPGCATIEEVCNYLKTPQEQSLKSLVYKSIKGDDESFVLVLLLGDDELNDVKLKSYLGADQLMPATEGEIQNLGLEKGYIGPVGMSARKLGAILFDREVKESAYFVVGANKVDKHTKNFNLKRDMSGDYEVADLRLAQEGDLTEEGDEVTFYRGIEVGHIFQLGDKYTRSMDAGVLDQNGKTVYPLMGCYGIGVTRVVAAAIEQNHDEKGIIWPLALAPADVHFVAITKSEESKRMADDLYQELLEQGFDVVFDDRKAGAGFKFKDADLLGVPLQLVFGERDFQKEGTLEICRRKDGRAVKVSKDEVIEKLKTAKEFLALDEDQTCELSQNIEDPLG